MAEALDIPISKVRRNTKEFLGDDPRAARRAGVRREFSLNDGFFVFLGGGLVTDYNLTFGNARRALEVIKPWLLKNQLVPEPPKGSKREGVDAGEPLAEKLIAHDDIYQKIKSGEIKLGPNDGYPGPEEPFLTEFYLTPYISEGRIIEICNIRVVAATDITVGLVDSIGREYTIRQPEEYYYFFRNNLGKLEYPKSIKSKGLTSRSGFKDDEIKKIWKRSKPIGEIPISEMLSNYIRSITRLA
jgi:hypothetical protein